MEPVVATNANEMILRVSNTSPASSLASAISYAVYDNKKVVLRAIGAGAVNQAAKAIAIARGYVAPRGIDLYFSAGFATVKMPDAKEVSAIVFKVFSL